MKHNNTKKYLKTNHKPLIVALTAVLFIILISSSFNYSFNNMAMGANSLDQLIANVPSCATPFYADGISGNGLNGPNTLWWDYHPEIESGDVYLLVVSSSAGKVANGAMLGAAVGVRIDYYQPGGNAAAYTLIKFTNVWLNYTEFLFVDMGSGYGTGQSINGCVSDYFPQLKTINYYDGDDFLGSNTVLSGSNVVVWDITYLSEVSSTGVFSGWSYTKGSSIIDVSAGEIISINDQDINLYVVWQEVIFTYTVEYYYGGVQDKTATETSSAEYGTVINSYVNKEKIGYKLGWDTAPILISENPSLNVIEVHYIPDYTQTRCVTYTVNYYIDDASVPFEARSVTEVIWVNGQSVTVDFVDYVNCPTGYRLNSISPALPVMVQDGDVIKVYYIPDYTQTRSVSYTVEYYIDDVSVPFDTHTIVVTTWINDPTITVNSISTANCPIGYKLYGIEPNLPAIIEDCGVIKVHYIPDYTQTRSVSYTVEYYIDDVVVPFASYTTSVDVWINDSYIEVNTVNMANLPIGYKLCSISPTLPAIVQDGAIIKVHYIPDYTQSKTISYTIQYYLYDIQNGNVLSDVEVVTESVWINDSDMLTVFSVDQDKYLPAYTLNYTVPNVIPKTIVDGGVIEVYYKQSVFTVTYVKGEYGGFDVEVYGGLYYGDVTPVFAGDVGVTSEVGWRFNGWSPMVASTVTGDVTYVAQWSVWDDISYTVHYYLVDTSSSVVLDKVVFGQVFGTLITEYAIDVVGYSALAPVSLSVILGISDNDFVFYYTVNPSIGDNNVGSNKPSYTFVPCVPAVSEDKFEEVAPESTVPVVSFKEQSVYWALLNLIISMVGIILVVVLSVFVLLWHNKKQKHDKEPQNVQNNVKTQNTMKQSNNSDVDYVEMMSMGEGKQKRKQHRVLLYFTALVMGVVGVVVFLFTEDMSHSRVWVDNWTVVNVLIFIVEVIAIVFTFKTKKVNKKEEDYEGKKGN